MGEKLHMKISLYAYMVHMFFSTFMKKMALNWALKIRIQTYRYWDEGGEEGKMAEWLGEARQETDWA